MNNGRIKALDIECFINGGCTLEESEQVCATETSVLAGEWNVEVLDESSWKACFLKYLPSSTSSSILLLDV